MSKSTGAAKTGSAKKNAATTVAPASTKPKQLPPYNVILLDDDDHTYEYVVQMLRAVFGYPVERGLTLARQVDESGRAVLMTTHRELAELKREQILAYGTDRRIASCQGSMSAIIEPA